jgi:hypothetical protein
MAGTSTSHRGASCVATSGRSQPRFQQPIKADGDIFFKNVVVAVDAVVGYKDLAAVARIQDLITAVLESTLISECPCCERKGPTSNLTRSCGTERLLDDLDRR